MITQLKYFHDSVSTVAILAPRREIDLLNVSNFF